jgi:hypothetical protein
MMKANTALTIADDSRSMPAATPIAAVVQTLAAVVEQCRESQNVRSSSVLPPASAAATHFGWRPRPLQVWLASSGLR